MDLTPLIIALGLDKMPPDAQQRMLESALRTLQNRMTLRLSQILTPEQMQELNEASTRSEQDGQAALERICPNYDEMYQEEVLKLKDDMA
jgi:transcriptional regulator with GAF, ATPase, and Fis domain